MFDFGHLAHMTPGYVGADLMALCREAAMCAVNRVLIQMEEENRDAPDDRASAQCTEDKSEFVEKAIKEPAFPTKVCNYFIPVHCPL